MLLTLLLTTTIRPSAEDIKKIFLPEAVIYNSHDQLFQAMAHVESKNDPLAYNEKEGAVGILQIRQVFLDDYNKRTGGDLRLEDCYSPEVSKKIFLWHASRYKSAEEIARTWNGGPNGMQLEATKQYWENVNQFYNN